MILKHLIGCFVKERTWKLEHLSKLNKNEQTSKPILNIRTLKKHLFSKLSLVKPLHFTEPRASFFIWHGRSCSSVQQALPYVLHHSYWTSNILLAKGPIRLLFTSSGNSNWRVWDFVEALLGLILELVKTKLGSCPCHRITHHLGLSPSGDGFHCKGHTKWRRELNHTMCVPCSFS